ncbi:hypothetical protein J6590_065775 [Homalodisca vitripennis]|nr:hypothetical protein J6590_065775 [Homalodisca vitripennis]
MTYLVYLPSLLNYESPLEFLMTEPNDLRKHFEDEHSPEERGRGGEEAELLKEYLCVLSPFAYYDACAWLGK